VEPTSYQAHLRHKHVGYSGTYGCDQCDYKTLSSKNFSDHTVKHVDEHPDNRRSASANKDFSNKNFLNRYLIEDELGVGWNKRPLFVDDEQMSSLRRVASLEQERRKKAQLYSAKAASTSWPRPQLQLQRPPPVDLRRATTVQKFARTSEPSSFAVMRWRYDNGITASVNHSKSSISTAGSSAQSCFVPEAECFVEVKTDDGGSAESAITNCVDEASSDDGSSESDDDDDTASCSSSESGGEEIDARLTALTAGIDASINDQEPILNEHIDSNCQDLGNDILPDGQVDFDLD